MNVYIHLFIIECMQYECLDSNQVKAANLAEKVYKTSLTTKSHSLNQINYRGFGTLCQQPSS